METVQPVPTEFARGIAAAFWTGSDVVLAPTVFHGGASGPVPFNLRGVRYDPATGAYALMSHSAVNDSANATVWTGGSLVQFSWAQGGLSGSTPGDGQAWDPTTDTWFAVASAPFEGFGDQFVWTGSEIVAIGPGGGHQLAPAAHP